MPFRYVVHESWPPVLPNCQHIPQNALNTGGNSNYIVEFLTIPIQAIEPIDCIYEPPGLQGFNDKEEYLAYREQIANGSLQGAEAEKELAEMRTALMQNLQYEGAFGKMEEVLLGEQDDEGLHWLLGAVMQSKDWEKAQEIIVALPSNTPKEQAFKSVMEITRRAAKVDYFYELTENEEAILTQIAEGDYSSRAYARALLIWLKGIRFEFEEDFEGQALQSSPADMAPKMTFNVSPNPAEDFLQIEIQNLEGDKMLNLRIFDLFGHKCMKTDMQGHTIWLDTMVLGRQMSGQRAFFWKDTLLYYGHSIYNTARDSMVVFTAVNADGEQVLQKKMSYGGSDESIDHFFSYGDGFISEGGMGWGSCDDCDSTRFMFLDSDLNLVSEWRKENPYPAPGLAGLAHTLALPDGTFIGGDSGCTAVALCGLISRFDSTGNVIWDFELDQIAYYLGFNVPKTTLLNEDGDIAVMWMSSYSGEPSFTDGVPVFYKLNIDGDVEWTLYFDHDVQQQLRVQEIFTAQNDDIIVTGMWGKINQDEIPARRCGYIARISPQGKLLWERKICDVANSQRLDYEPEIDLVYGLELSGGDLVFTGQIETAVDPNSIPSVRSDIWFVRTDSEGCLDPGCGEFQLLTNNRELVSHPGLVKVFPNPASGQIFVDIAAVDITEKKNWFLYDALGRLVHT